MKTAEQLRISEAWRAALLLVLERLEAGTLRHTVPTSFEGVPRGEWFNMEWWNNFWAANEEGCGSIACIGGWAEKLGNVKFEVDGCSLGLGEAHPELEKLFYPKDMMSYRLINAEQASRALRNYLERGRADWQEVLGADDQ